MTSLPKFNHQLWVEELAIAMHPMFKLAMDTCPSIFRIPENLSAENPEAYKPQHIGLGPYHHFQPHLYKKSWQKLASAKSVLKEEQLMNFQAVIVDKLRTFEPFIRTYYDTFLEMDGNMLSWVVTVDALFLIHQFYLGRVREDFVGDIMMLENQIPMVLLAPMLTNLKDHDSSLFRDKVIQLCVLNSPLLLAEESRFRYHERYMHLLDLMYHLIINNRGMEEEPVALVQSMDFTRKAEVVFQAIDVASGIFGSKDIVNGVTFAKKLPWDKVTSLFSTKQGSDELGKINEQEIRIPCVSQLRDIARVEFCALKREGIRDINFNEENRTFYLPVIKIDKNSEVILRNLVAYEALMAKEWKSSNLELAEYVDLMCGIIDTAKDVEELRDKGIIAEGGLSDEEIAKMFNGMKKTTGDGKRDYGLEKAVEKLNQRFDNTMKVKFYRFMKKHVYHSWKFLTVLATVVLIVLMVLQAFCDVYGCSSRLFNTK